MRNETTYLWFGKLFELWLKEQILDGKLLRGHVQHCVDSHLMAMDMLRSWISASQWNVHVSKAVRLICLPILDDEKLWKMTAKEKPPVSEG